MSHEAKLAAKERAVMTRLEVVADLSGGRDEYNRAAHPLLATVQELRPRCVVGCPCFGSRVWREFAERIVDYVDKQ